MLSTVAVAVCALFGPAESTAQEKTIQVGAVAGPNFSQLNQPSDPAGEVTVLAGTAFSGLGVTAGATSAFKLLKVPYGALFAEIDLLYSHHRGSGFAESRTSDARRELTITTDMLRIPLFARYDVVDDPISLRFALGPELLLGLGSEHEVRQTGVDAPPTGSFTTAPVRHVGLATKLSASYEGDGWRIPIDFRVTLDPSVGASSRERFFGYESIEEPGRYQVAFNYHFLFVAGFEYDIVLGG